MKKCFTWVIGFLILAAACFFITSLCLASNHGKTLTEEWESWTVEKKEEKPAEKTEDKEEQGTIAEAQIEDDSISIDPNNQESN